MAKILTIVWSQVPLGDGWGPECQDEVVWVDVMKLDQSWRDDSCYVGPGGTGESIEGRYEAVGKYISAARPLYMPSVCLDDDGVICFTDGRHRVAWLRDHGVEALPIEVPPRQAAVIEARFGTPCRNSILKL
jgi:hypothetical protein